MLKNVFQLVVAISIAQLAGLIGAVATSSSATKSMTWIISSHGQGLTV